MADQRQGPGPDQQLEQRVRLHSYMTKSRFLHIEDALDIGKLRVFAGEYTRGQGTSVYAIHYLDLEAARVLFADMAWGKVLDYAEFKGTPGDKPVSRVLKLKTTDGKKVWFRLETGPGQVMGQGAIKPDGEPTAIVNVPLTIWDSRVLASAVLAYIQAWEVTAVAEGLWPGDAS